MSFPARSIHFRSHIFHDDDDEERVAVISGLGRESRRTMSRF
jgi:hypothetical protein